MGKEKIKMEYMLKGGSGNVIWSIISTPSGLETWFADKVTAKEKLYTFQWGKTETRQAEVVHCRTNQFIRFHLIHTGETNLLGFAKPFYQLTVGNIRTLRNIVPDEASHFSYNPDSLLPAARQMPKYCQKIP